MMSSMEKVYLNLSWLLLLLTINFQFIRSSEVNQCITIGGNYIGTPCKFPFVYDVWDDIPYVPATVLRWFSSEIKYENCIDNMNSGRSWCATKVSSQNKYVQGYWGECPDSLSCNAVEGSWLPWSSWSDLNECTGGICGERGMKSTNRTRKKFSRIGEDNGMVISQIINAPYEQSQKRDESCFMPECAGWRYRQCRGGVDIFRSNESYLISLVDNEEECKAICEAMPECDLANFIVNTKFPEVNRCVPRKEFRGHCDRTFSLLKLVKSYIKNKTDSTSTELLGPSNSKIKWEWNALRNGSSYDCRLCVPTRSSNVWSSCREDCRNIPTEISDVNFFLQLIIKGSSVYRITNRGITKVTLTSLMESNAKLGPYITPYLYHRRPLKEIRKK